MLKFKPGWNSEIAKYVHQFGPYKAFLMTLNEAAISKALFDTSGHFNNQWVRELVKIAMDPFDRHEVVIEQGTHQAENLRSGGFCLHFTGRDTYGFAFHFYIRQKMTGQAEIFEITYSDKGRIVSVNRA